MTNTIRSKIERLADRKMWRYELGEFIWDWFSRELRPIPFQNPKHHPYLDHNPRGAL